MSRSAVAAVGSGVPVRFLMYNVDARDGVSRAVLTLVNELVRTHPVEIISLYQRHEGPAYAISPDIRVTYLFDHPPVPRTDAATGEQPVPDTRYARRLRTRHPVRNLLARRRSRLADGRNFPNYSLLTDRALARALRGIDDGVVVSTRPALHAALARLARPGVVTIGQDHLNFMSRTTEPGSMAFIEEACRRGLRGFVTLTPSDAEDYRRTLAGTGTVVTSIPNALSWPVSAPQERTARVVVSAGRLVPRKAMAQLVAAFAPVARRHPDWELRIYGTGPLAEKLQRRIDRLDVRRQIRLMGHTEDLPAAFDDASVFASSSVAEGFPMVMLEALSKGLPIVGTDCPRGPGDIIRHGRNGLLVPNRDVEALSEALEQVVSDDALRRSMGAEALTDAEQYVPASIAARWTRLFEELGARPSAG
ncbi:MAG TPA: glycosyltransferase [Propionibacteriaceae bacterium]|nr:glycosyltransferase [Propionibacteriaceae bacterium]